MAVEGGAVFHTIRLDLLSFGFVGLPRGNGGGHARCCWNKQGPNSKVPFARTECYNSPNIDIISVIGPDTAFKGYPMATALLARNTHNVADLNGVHHTDFQLDEANTASFFSFRSLYFHQKTEKWFINFSLCKL